MSFILPPRPTMPLSWPAIVVYLDQMSTATAYVLHSDESSGGWTLVALDPDIMPNLTHPAPSQPIEVDVAADLRRQPPGTTTIITSLEES